MRSAGILLPLFSLPSKYGIGGFGKEAFEFVDFLERSHQKFWQILPIGPTGYGDSPYQTFSTFAGNPYFISLEILIDEGLLKKSECSDSGSGKSKAAIDYGKVYRERFGTLKKAYDRSKHHNSRTYKEFIKKNSFWLDDYSLFMAIKNSKGGVSFTEWEDSLRLRKKSALKDFRQKNADEIEFQKFLQYKFFEQFSALKAYANDRGIKIIGDIPIYVSPDSSDLWASPELFQANEDGTLKAVAGCPPDAFSASGQLWGNPLYDWKYHEKTRYDWWIKRVRHCAELYDIVRIDHFRGFDQYYSIPAGSKDAKIGAWEDGPGISLFKAIREKLGKISIIAEDLGYITPSVRKLVKNTGFPNMKVLEFAFDPNDVYGKGDYLPHNFPRNCVVYTGTHDNETLAGWVKSLKAPSRRKLLDYLGLRTRKTDVIVDGLIRIAMMSVADYCIIPLQDYLCLDNDARINFPSTLGNNWQWRYEKESLTPELSDKIRNLTDRYGRWM